MMDDVRHKKCITCGAPSREGLCSQCRHGGKKRKFEPSDDETLRRGQKGWWRTGIQYGNTFCNCAECVAGRTKQPKRPYGFGRPRKRKVAAQ